MKKPHANLKLLLIVGLFAVLGSVGMFRPSNAQTISELQKRSAALQAEIDAADKKASELANEAKSLKNTIAVLDVQIQQAQKQIELTNTEIKRLEKELSKAESELDRQKALLAANMRALYKRGGASTVELLVASDSFSQFIDEQEYLERLKAGIQESAEKVIALKLEIQKNKEDQENLLRQQEDAKRALADSRSERERVLAYTQGQEAEYRAYSRSLADKQRSVNRQLLALSRLVSSGGSGDYPWSNALCVATDQANGNCFDYEWYVNGKSDRQDPWGYYYRNCTSYVAWRSAQKGLEVPGLGNGGQWANNSWKYSELSTGSVPKAGSFAVFTTGGYGHVAYVEDVSGSEVLVSEYNFVADGVFSQRWIPKSQPTRYVYTPWSD